MIAEINLGSEKKKVNLLHPIDLSIPLKGNKNNVTAWYVDAPIITPVKGEGFIGEVKQGGSVNFRNIQFNPHGHGTHTECVGHISEDDYSINQTLKTFFFIAKLVTINPEKIKDDKVISLQQIQEVWNKEEPAKAIIIRTLPNTDSKLSQQYSNTNPAFIHHDAIQFLVNHGVEHLLIDTPSVDKEIDGGALLSHKAFWEYPNKIQKQRTITEMFYAPSSIKDNYYLLNLQIAPFENDASPSKPILYAFL